MGTFSPCVHARVTWSYLSHHDFLAALGIGRPAKSLLRPRLERWKVDLGSLERKLHKGRAYSLFHSLLNSQSPEQGLAPALWYNTDGRVLPCPVTEVAECIFCVFLCVKPRVRTSSSLLPFGRPHSRLASGYPFAVGVWRSEQKHLHPWSVVKNFKKPCSHHENTPNYTFQIFLNIYVRDISILENEYVNKVNCTYK